MKSVIVCLSIVFILCADPAPAPPAAQRIDSKCSFGSFFDSADKICRTCQPLSNKNDVEAGKVCECGADLKCTDKTGCLEGYFYDGSVCVRNNCDGCEEGKCSSKSGSY